MFSPNFMKKFAKLTDIWCFSWSCVKRAAEPRGTLNAFFAERHFSTALTVYRENYTSNWHEQGHLLFGKPVAITWRSAFFNFRPASIFFSNISPILYPENMTFFSMVCHFVAFYNFDIFWSSRNRGRLLVSKYYCFFEFRLTIWPGDCQRD